MRNSSNTTRNINKHRRYHFLLTSVEESSHLGGGGLNLDQTGMCHQHLKFYHPVLEWENPKRIPCSGVTTSFLNLLYFIVLYCIVLYCIVLYCIVLYCIVSETKIMFTLYLFNQMSLPFPFSSIMLVQKSFKFSITVIRLSYDICIVFQD